MEVSPSTTAASLLLSSFPGHAGMDAGVQAPDNTATLRWNLEMLVRYVRCFREHKSGAIIAAPGGDAGKAVRYRCAGCGLLWSPRWRQ